MQKIGNDKTEKLNNTLIGADASVKSDAPGEKALRERFAEELLLAHDRAEERILEMNYARKFREKLRKSTDAGVAATVKEEAPTATDASSGKLRAELDEIEKRRLKTEALLLNLSAKGQNALEAKPEENSSCQKNIRYQSPLPSFKP